MYSALTLESKKLSYGVIIRIAFVCRVDNDLWRESPGWGVDGVTSEHPFLHFHLLSTLLILHRLRSLSRSFPLVLSPSHSFCSTSQPRPTAYRTYLKKAGNNAWVSIPHCNCDICGLTMQHLCVVSLPSLQVLSKFNWWNQHTGD